jgi:TolB protein
MEQLLVSHRERQTIMRRHFLYYPSISLLAIVVCLAPFFLGARGNNAGSGVAVETSSSLAFQGEKHLANIRQLTFGGQNAEAYFSADDKFLTFQHQGQFYDEHKGVPIGGNVPCDQIYTMPVPATGKNSEIVESKRVSNGEGRTTCSYFFPSGDRILYSSTFAASPACPAPPDYSQGYVWPIYDTYSIYTAKPDGSDIQQLSKAPGYNAESTITRDGKHVVFTSTRNGDIDIYTMDADGSHVKQLTHELGYDGGPFWSYDGKKIVYRAEHPKTP